MEVSDYRQQSIGPVALYVEEVYITLLIYGHLPPYGYAQIESDTGSSSCSLQFDGQFVSVSPGSYFRWLQWQYSGTLTGVFVEVNLHILLKTNPTAYGCRLPRFPTILQCALGFSHVF